MDKKETLGRLLNMLYEAEALTEMAIKRDGQPAVENIISLITDKCRQIADMESKLHLADANIDDANTTEEPLFHTSIPTDSDNTETQDEDPDDADNIALAESEMREIVAMASADPEDDGSVLRHDSPESLELITPELDPEMEESEAEVGFNPPPGYTPEESVEKAQTDHIDSPREIEFVEEEEEPSFVPENHIIGTEEEDNSYEEEEITEPEEEEAEEVAEIEETEQEENIPTTYTYIPEKVNPLGNIPRTPILSFFTINDRFRFRRSLFHGDNPSFLNALSVIESVDSFQQAEDYMADDLQWDLENKEVKLFSKIIERYFKELLK